MIKNNKHNRKKTYPLSDHYDGKHFFNPGLSIVKKFKHVIRMLAEGIGKNKWPKHVRNHATPKLASADISLNQANITYINHASHLIQFKKLNILTDPIFSKRASPLTWFGPKRVRSPGISLEELPHIHVVLISHNHYDHMDLPSLKKLEQLFHPLVIVPLGNQKYLRSIKHVVELDWWQSHSINAQQSITLVPSQHWSRRKLDDTNKALWGGFWIQSDNIKIYFAGDSGYGPLFKEIQQSLGSPSISILPIGSYEPRWFMKPQHMNPEEAVLASIDLQSSLNIATHHATFRLSHEGIDDPLFDLKASLKRHKINNEKFLAPENGETIIYRT